MIPSTGNGKVALQIVSGTAAGPAPGRQPPRRLPQKTVRVREYLTEDECRTLIATAKKRGGRYGLRDALAIRNVLAAWAPRQRTGSAALGSRRMENRTPYGASRQGLNRQHAPIQRRSLQRTQEPGCRFIFMNERRAPMTAAGFRKMLSAVRAACGQPHVHPHMLRHSCGYMADHSQDVRVMQDWLGHANANVQITVRYTALAPGRLDKAKAPG